MMLGAAVGNFVGQEELLDELRREVFFETSQCDDVDADAYDHGPPRGFGGKSQKTSMFC